jgi:hypothetical protein
MTHESTETPAQQHSFINRKMFKHLSDAFNGNKAAADVADLLNFRMQGTCYSDSKSQYIILKNVQSETENTLLTDYAFRGALKYLQKHFGLVVEKIRISKDCAVRFKIRLGEKITSIFSKLTSMLFNQKQAKNTSEAPKNNEISDSQSQRCPIRNLIYKDTTNKENNTIKAVDDSITLEQKETVKNVVLGNEEKIIPSLIDCNNIPELTTDKTLLENLTEHQIDSIEQVSNDYQIEATQLFDTVSALTQTKSDMFDDFNQVLAVGINQQLEPKLQAEALKQERDKSSYEIDYRAIDLANDETLEVLDESQEYAIDHNLLYLQKHVGKRFDFNELKSWVKHALLSGYKGAGFKKALRSIVWLIKNDKFTRPYSLKANYSAAV